MIKNYLSKYLIIKKLYILYLNLMKPIFRLIRLTLSPLLSFTLIRGFSFNIMKIDNLIEVKVDGTRFLVNTSDKVISKNIYSNLKFPE